MNIKRDYEFVLNNLNEVIVEWNLESNQFYFSKNWNNITGYDITDESNFFEELIKIIYPQDINILDKALMKYIEEKSPSFSCQYRIITKDGRLKWILHEGKAIEDKESYLTVNYISDITYKKDYEEEINYFAYYDIITNIPNRLFLVMKLNKYFNSTNLKNKLPMSLFIININKFKIIDNLYGNELGDSLLKKTADIIKSKLRKKDVFCSLDGGKFALVVYDLKDISSIRFEAEGILSLFDGLIELDGKKLFLDISIGIAIYSNGIKNADEILKRASIALSYSKKKGKNAYSIYDKKMEIEFLNRVKIEIELKQAIEKKEFMLYFQPQIDTNINQIYGIEALIRWNHPKRGILAPSYFIDIIEQNGMINAIGKYVLREACGKMKELSRLGYENLNVSVNISENQLEDDLFLEFVKKLVCETDIDSSHLCFEITERILMNPTKRILGMLYEFKRMGIKIFIDDFGIKYSSLSCLTSLPVDGIKIDKSFVDEMENSNKDLILLKTIVNLAHDMNLELIAEGVETKKQLKILNDIDCYKIQGFIFSKPVSFKKLIETLNKKYKNKIFKY